MDQDFQQFIIDQFANVATKEDLKQFATKEDIQDINAEISEIKGEISTIKLDMATKNDILEVKGLITKLDQRTDEDTKATIKDISKIKEILQQQGHAI